MHSFKTQILQNVLSPQYPFQLHNHFKILQEPCHMPSELCAPSWRKTRFCKPWVQEELRVCHILQQTPDSHITSDIQECYIRNTGEHYFVAIELPSIPPDTDCAKLIERFWQQSDPRIHCIHFQLHQTSSHDKRVLRTELSRFSTKEYTVSDHFDTRERDI